MEQLLFVKEDCLDDNILFILEDKKGVRRMMIGNSYKSFCFKPGMIVQVVMRRRGCAGEQITELLHPVYKTGSSYLFKILDLKMLNMNDSVIHFLIVTDEYDNTYRIKVRRISDYKGKDHIWCTLKEQNKGKLIFEIDPRGKSVVQCPSS